MQSAEPGWSSLPAISRVVTPQPATFETSSFVGGLASHTSPALLQPLVHDVSQAAPSGIIGNLVVARSVGGPGPSTKDLGGSIGFPPPPWRLNPGRPPEPAAWVAQAGPEPATAATPTRSLAHAPAPAVQPASLTTAIAPAPAGQTLRPLASPASIGSDATGPGPPVTSAPAAADRPASPAAEPAPPTRTVETPPPPVAEGAGRESPVLAALPVQPRRLGLGAPLALRPDSATGRSATGRSATGHSATGPAPTSDFPAGRATGAPGAPVQRSSPSGQRPSPPSPPPPPGLAASGPRGRRSQPPDRPITAGADLTPPGGSDPSASPRSGSADSGTGAGPEPATAVVFRSVAAPAPSGEVDTDGAGPMAPSVSRRLPATDPMAADLPPTGPSGEAPLLGDRLLPSTPHPIPPAHIPITGARAGEFTSGPISRTGPPLSVQRSSGAAFSSAAPAAGSPPGAAFAPAVPAAGRPSREQVPGGRRRCRWTGPSSGADAGAIRPGARGPRLAAPAVRASDEGRGSRQPGPGRSPAEPTRCQPVDGAAGEDRHARAAPAVHPHATGRATGWSSATEPPLQRRHATRLDATSHPAEVASRAGLVAHATA